MKARELVARNLRRLRVDRGLPQEILAVDADIDRVYVSRIERGIVSPTVDVLEKLAKALDAPLTELFAAQTRGEPRPKPLPSGRKRRRPTSVGE